MFTGETNGVTEHDVREAQDVYRKLHPEDGHPSTGLYDLNSAVYSGDLVPVGGLCFATSDAAEHDLIRYKAAANEGKIKAVILGPGVLLGTHVQIRHSIVDAGSDISYYAIIRDGCQVNASEIYGGELWNTATDNAEFRNVQGSSGGNVVTGRLNNHDLAASGIQVIATPRSLA